MKIISNETFECYETAFESWNNNDKSITLDGQLLIPIAKIRQAKEEIKSISQEVPYRNQAFSYGISICETDRVLKILDKLMAESEG